MKINLIVTATGYAPADQHAIDVRRKHHKPGKIVVGDVVVPRNRKFHNKLFALLNLAFEQWEPDETKLYKGRVIEKDFDQFRKDITILAGFYDVVWRVNGDMRIEAKSLAVDQMDPDAFENLYNAVIKVLLEQVLNAKGFQRSDVDKLVADIINFDS